MAIGQYGVIIDGVLTNIIMVDPEVDVVEGALIPFADLPEWVRNPGTRLDAPKPEPVLDPGPPPPAIEGLQTL